MTVWTPSASGKGQKIVRCPECQVASWSHRAGGGASSFVRVGTLDDPDRLWPGASLARRRALLEKLGRG